MEILDQLAMLESFSIIVDKREQPTERAESRYETFGVPWDHATINYGDYTYNAILPNGEPIYDITQTLFPKCVVERKMDIDELAACMGNRGRTRFENEMKRAQDAGAKVYLFVENATWENLNKGDYKSLFNPNALKASLCSFIARYDLGLFFCKEELTGMLIKEILYRDLKMRIERGDFDERVDMPAQEDN